MAKKKTKSAAKKRTRTKKRAKSRTKTKRKTVRKKKKSTTAKRRRKTAKKKKIRKKSTAKKKPAKRRTTKKSKKKKSVKRPTTAARLDKLEKAVASLKRSNKTLAQRAASAQSIRTAAGGRIVGLAQKAASSVTVKFTKTADSPSWVRVSVQGRAGFVINVGETEGSVDGLTAGDWLIVRMEVRGNPFDKATVKFADGSPDSMAIEIPKDESANSGIQTVAVL